ncbi:hypothetical protein MIND_00209100 [Mycena indigotica]|uniref:Uncharacterized protein n=1 Tax=Mycena indigotica TaxID=2126181 RepID=A0A8H6T720_9AGAR|nr:uncharacterized protein MIND_00209100 [Mycena indigotica]KAF7311974.1 hypothetical protein MIND_00209100 [Mycena indigotica]
MAAPTQELPPWLSYTTITLPQTTETSVVFLPLTYYGPSIPLDSDWVYGGLTSPVSTSTPASSSIPLTSSSALSSSTPLSTAPPSSSSPSQSSVLSSAISSSSVSSTSPTTTSPSSSSAMPSSSSSSIAVASSSTGLSHGQLIGVIIGSILGAFVLFLLFFSCCLRWCRRRRGDPNDPQTLQNVPASRGQRKTSGSRFTALLPRRQRRARTRFTMVTPGNGIGSTDEFDADWLMVQTPGSPPTRPTEPGTGRTEVDPFLTSAGLPNPHPGSASGNNSGSGSSRETGATTGSSGTNVSGYGVLLAHPSLSLPDNHEGNPFDLPTSYSGGNNHALPPGAAPPTTTYANIMPGRRILSPSQLAMLVEEEGEREVLPRPSGELPRNSMQGSHISGDEEGEVVYARRVAVSGPDTPPELPQAQTATATPFRRSWIPRFSWLRDSRGSREIEDDVEAGTGLLFDASSPSAPSSPAGPRSQQRSKRPSAEMREFGTKPFPGFLSSSRPATPGSRPVSGAARPLSGVSSDGTNGTNGSGKSGGTVYTDARETLSTRGSNSRVGTGPPTQHDPMPEIDPDTTLRADPLDAPAPVAFAPFSSAASLHHSASRTSLTHSASEASLSQQTQPTLSHHGSSEGPAHPTLLTLTSGSSPSASTLATTTTKPEAAYAFGPPGLGFNVDSQKPGSVGSWDKAGLEMGFARAASIDKLGTFGSGNRGVLQAPGPFAPPPLPVFNAPPPPRSPPPSVSYGSSGTPGIRIIGSSNLRSPMDLPQRAPHLSLDLDDAPPGADGGWRLLGGTGSTPSLLNNEWGVGVGGPGKRGTFGGPSNTAAQYVSGSGGPSSEHGSLHSRLDNSINSSSLSSRSIHSRNQNNTSSSSNSNPTPHSQYPSSNSARSRAALGRPISVPGPMSPANSAFGVRHLPENSGSSGSGNGHGNEMSGSSLPRARSPASPTLMAAAPWAGGLGEDWRAT